MISISKLDIVASLSTLNQLHTIRLLLLLFFFFFFFFSFIKFWQKHFFYSSNSMRTIRAQTPSKVFITSYLSTFKGHRSSYLNPLVLCLSNNGDTFLNNWYTIFMKTHSFYQLFMEHS